MFGLFRRSAPDEEQLPWYEQYSKNIKERLNKEQKDILDVVLTKIRKADKKDQKIIILVSGGPGTGKSLVALSVLTEVIKLKYSILYLLQGQTLRRTENLAPKDLVSYFESWDARPFQVARPDETTVVSELKFQKNSQSIERDVIIVDESHLMMPFPGLDPFTSSRTEFNKKEGVQDREDLLSQGNVSLLEVIAESTTQALVIVRDESQRVHEWSMRENEFKIILQNLTKKGWRLAETETLKTQYRTSPAWIKLLAEILVVGEISLSEIDVGLTAARNRNSRRNLFIDDYGSNQEYRFKAALLDEWSLQTAIRTLALDKNKGCPVHSRILATFSWPDDTTWKVGDQEFTWAGSQEKDQHKRKSIARFSSDQYRYKLSKFGNARAEADVILKPEVFGVGYIKAVQGIEFEDVLVLVGDHLKLVRNDNGTIKWTFTSKKRIGRTASNSLETALNELRVLLTRGRNGCFVYFQDKATRSLLTELLEIHDGELSREGNYHVN